MRRRNDTHFTKTPNRGHFIFIAITLLAALASCGTPTEPAPATPSPIALDPTYEAMIISQRSLEVPDLPFPDNPDPSACGIPVVWGKDDPAWLNGEFRGELIQPVVYLYDSHLRLDISARAPHGSVVTVLLYQQNPVTDYYLVKVNNMEPPNEGWIPAPLLSFEPVTP